MRRRDVRLAQGEPAVTEERWVPVRGFEGHYEVSNHGRVRSLERLTISGYDHRGIRTDGNVYLAVVRTCSGLYVMMTKNNKRKNWRLARLVYTHFVEELPPEMIVRCTDPDGDCSLENLVVMTRRELLAETVHGRTRELK